MKILYATDGLSPAHAAGRLLERIADPHKVEIAALAVFETVVRTTPDFPEIVLEQVARRARWAAETADDAAQMLLRGDYKAGAITAEGDPGEEVIRAVGRAGFDLTVMGAGRKGWLGNLLLGSVSLHVLHSSPSSVLIAHETEERHGAARILLGTDGSPGALFARQTLVDLADPERCRVRVVAVAPTAPAVVRPVPGAEILPPTQAHDDEISRQLTERAERYAEETAAHLRVAGFHAVAHTSVGHPAGQLLDEARRWDADLAVVGARGLGPMRRALLGSVSDRIARHAPATLVARHAGDEKAPTLQTS